LVPITHGFVDVKERKSRQLPPYNAVAVMHLVTAQALRLNGFRDDKEALVPGFISLNVESRIVRVNRIASKRFNVAKWMLS
jgi:hypothetical protein